MIYLDTSVVVALLTPEERSAQALDWFGQSRDPLISSDWLITQTHSALGIKQSHHGLSSEAPRQAAGVQFGMRSGVGMVAARIHHWAVSPRGIRSQNPWCDRVI